MRDVAEDTAGSRFCMCGTCENYREYPFAIYFCRSQHSVKLKQILNKLEQKGFVSVEPDAADRRKLRISLTEYAGVMAEKYRLKEDEFMDGLFYGVEEEWAQVSVFYCPGGLRYENMKMGSKVMMKMFAKMMAKKKDKTEDEKVMAEMIGKSYNISERKYITPIVECLQAK